MDNRPFDNIPRTGASAPPAAPVPPAPAPGAPPTFTPYAAPAYYPYAGPPVKVKTPAAVDGSDKLFALFSVVIGFVFCEFALFRGLSFGMPAFFAAAYALIIGYGRKSRSIDVKKGAALLVPIVLLLLCNAVYGNPALNALNFPALFFFAVLHLMSMFGARNYPALTKELFVDFLNGFFVRPVMNLDKIFVVSAKGVKEKGGRKLGWRILLGFLVCIPVLAVIIALLSSADKAFESLVRKIGDIIGNRILEYLFKIFLGAVLAVPLFGAVYSFRYKKGRPDAKAVTLPAKLDPAVAYTVLSLVCAVYFVFLFVQFNYMFLAFAGRLPENFIYSEYARRGFFELAAVAAINLAISAAAYVFSPKKSGKPAAALKVLLLTLSFVTLVIIGSAFAKMAMYMDVFGLTRLRVWTSWFMILTAAVFLMTIVKVLSSKFSVVKAVCVFFTVWYLVLNLAGTDAVVAKFNVEKYRSDTSAALDVGMFYRLSDSMVPFALDILKETDKKWDLTTEQVQMVRELKSLLSDRYDLLQNESPLSQSAAGLYAEKLLAENKAAYYLAPAYRYCEERPMD
ncbi:MAG TPA: DUF4173 domain-containing protein [Clostridiales bacterium]|nr:DUF4173 domain-containing protein [Clostridiales bacterium]HQK73958.1 DUF4173 domain-containing protein [Clostridiales bacterium]